MYLSIIFIKYLKQQTYKDSNLKLNHSKTKISASKQRIYNKSKRMKCFIDIFKGALVDNHYIYYLFLLYQNKKRTTIVTIVHNRNYIFNNVLLRKS